MIATLKKYLSLFLVFFLSACSAINKEHYFAPRLDTFDNTGYVPSAEKVSGYEPTPAPIVQLSGGKQRLVLTSDEYRIELEVQTIISERPLFIGPCIIIPLPVIPIMFYKRENKADVVFLKGSISSLKGDRFSLSTISATVNSRKFSRVEILEPKIEYIYKGGAYEVSHPQAAFDLKQQVLKFGAKIPVAIQQLERLDVELHMVDSRGKEIFAPSVHFGPDGGVKWLVCFM